ncbi:RDD family protein [Shewanella oneidensis MR-1]|uniref:RDD domain protein n=1 Tax=Shewanella oneidensis (strain ATCC 700550 / JCM 31522 / CIP 106686 / LMG 19005 / NCIMB 14063 / MR-1) TaxID=211586 RepID=Q8ED65_SHEON|nr:RDD family protein [Shewanella oneidensis]AAN55918.2 RDD domain protein [Shewanella oneidensis MR-1]MDX5999645.1 RDD family protein [Shewanella oneidensis]MEE2028460.1 hypothetical protein [Shewanella oneidensis]QKG97367.1 RDD family protein [Shewanella oneidensis MR-1]
MKQQQTDLGKDPKTMVTPKAFTIAESVLYTPLATPLKRALAMLVDGLFIALFAEQMDWLFVLLVVGIIYIEKRSRQFGRLLKWGLYAAMLVLMLFTSATSLWDFHIAEKSSRVASSSHEINEVIPAIPALVSLGLCEDANCARQQILSLTRSMDKVDPTDMSPLERRDMVLATLGSANVSEVDKAQLRSETLNGPLWPAVDVSMVKTPPTLTQKENISSQAPQSASLALLKPNSEQQIDKQGEEQIDEQAMLSQSQPTQISRALNDNPDEDESRSIVAWIKGFTSDMGLGFGWAAFYFTVFTAKFDGQTLGKKLLGIRVILLDGAKISLWAAFGRYGGYAAGFTTGLLGFMQIFWDANRQGIQDKISSTVVIDLAQMHKKQQLEQQQAQAESAFAAVSTLDNATSAHLTTSTRLEHL